METNDSAAVWKSPTWKCFIQLLQLCHVRRTPEEKKDLLRCVVATASDEVDSSLLACSLICVDFVSLLMERNDVYQDVFFVSEMDHILRKVFYYRNLTLFVPLMERFSPLYLNYLHGLTSLLTPRSYVSEDLTRKELPSLLYSLLLSYPMSRSLLRELVPSLNAFLGAVKWSWLSCFPVER